jgi:hypothetical protein
MNKQYAIEIIEMVERRTLDKKSPLLKEAINYLNRLKKVDKELRERIYKLQYGNT